MLCLHALHVSFVQDLIFIPQLLKIETHQHAQNSSALLNITYSIAVRSLGTAAAGAAYLLLKFALGFGQPALPPLAMLILPPTSVIGKFYSCLPVCN